MNQFEAFIQRRIGPFPVWGWALIIVGGVALAIFFTKRFGSGGTDQASTNAGSAQAGLPDTIDPLTGVPYAIESAINPNTGLPAYYGTGGGGAGGTSGGGGGSGGGSGGTGGSGDGNNGGSGGGGTQYPNGALFSFAEWQQEIKRYPGGIAAHPHWMSQIQNSTVLTTSEKLSLENLVGGGAHERTGVAAPGAAMPHHQTAQVAMMAQPFGRNAQGPATQWEQINGLRRVG